MGNRMDPRKQFSKWLARYGAIAWGVFLAMVVALMFARPETAMPCVWLVLIVTVNKALDTLAYTDNSKTEKVLLSMIDRTRMELSLKSGNVQAEVQEEHEQEGESNG